MIKKNFINKEQIARSIARELKLPISKAIALACDIEVEILRELKTKGRVKLTNFGTFYLGIRSSRTIKQITSKKPRLLLESQSIKFKPAQIFKDLLVGIKRQELREEEKTVPEARGVISVPDTRYLIPDTRYRLPNFKPLAIMPRVEKEKIRKKIFERMLKIAQAFPPETAKEASLTLPTRKILQQTPEGRLFGALIRRIITLGKDSFYLNLSSKPETQIYFDRPKKLLARALTQTVKKFLSDVLELEHFEIPQERNIKIILEGETRLSFSITVYSLPLDELASLYFKISGRKIENK